MNYGQLFSDLAANPPTGWRVMHYVSGEPGGVYFWPSHIPHLIEPAIISPDGRLLHFTMLFEFHVIKKSNRARILARTRFHGTKPRNDFRWLSLQHLATQHCGGKVVKEVPATHTASVALWDGGNLPAISYKSPVNNTANLLRSFFSNPPTELSIFISHL
ncbi:MAG: hypothetical protein WCJ07_07140 [Verrucomicrobiota bacterium]